MPFDRLAAVVSLVMTTALANHLEVMVVLFALHSARAETPLTIALPLLPLVNAAKNFKTPTIPGEVLNALVL